GGGIRGCHVTAVESCALPISGVPVLWLAWVEGKKTAGTDVLLGEQLARLYLSEGKKYGWKGTTSIGRLKQQSGWTDDWITYYREDRKSVVQGSDVAHDGRHGV